MEAWPERLQGMPDDVKEGMRELLDECKQDMEENIRSIRYETDARAKTPASRVTGALKAHDARPPRGRALTGSVRPPHPPPPRRFPSRDRRAAKGVFFEREGFASIVVEDFDYPTEDYEDLPVRRDRDARQKAALGRATSTPGARLFFPRGAPPFPCPLTRVPSLPLPLTTRRRARRTARARGFAPGASGRATSTSPASSDAASPRRTRFR
jgi:hypothetical protein